ncbi:MAG: hypothetical protein Q7U84_10065 [Polynucleobacter sp.]|nr:hypothetical protein [Polynucleobacter sp.]
MNLHAIETEMLRLQLWALAVGLVTFIVTMWALYIVIKAAIRDGIQESGLVKTWAQTAANAHRPKDGIADMHAER